MTYILQDYTGDDGQGGIPVYASIDDNDEVQSDANDQVARVPDYDQATMPQAEYHAAANTPIDDAEYHQASNTNSSAGEGGVDIYSNVDDDNVQAANLPEYHTAANTPVDDAEYHQASNTNSSAGEGGVDMYANVDDDDVHSDDSTQAPPLPLKAAGVHPIDAKANQMTGRISDYFMASVMFYYLKAFAIDACVVVLMRSIPPCCMQTDWRCPRGLLTCTCP